MNPRFRCRLHDCQKKVSLIYSSSNFRDENTWDEKRLASSYTSVQMIVRAYHLEREYKDAPKFG